MFTRAVISSRAGQANVYVDDTDVGYVVSVVSGSTYGSLNYALNNDVGEYVVFSNVVDGQTIEVDGGTINRSLSIVGNGVEKTIIDNSDLAFGSNGITIVNIRVQNSYIKTPSSITIAAIENSVFDNVHPNTNALVKAYNIEGSTFSNSNLTYSNGWGITVFGTMTSCKVVGCSASNGRVVFALSSANSNRTISNCIFEDNSNRYGAALTVYGKGVTTVTGSTFTNSGILISSSEGPGRGILNDCVLNNSNISVASDANNGAATVTFSGVNVLNSTVSGAGQIVFANGSTIISTGDGSSEHPRGVIQNTNISGATINGDNIAIGVLLDGIVLTGTTATTHKNHMFFNGTVRNCIITNNYGINSEAGNNYPRLFRGCYISGCTFSGNTGWFAVIGGGTVTDSVTQDLMQHGKLTLSGSIIVNGRIVRGGGSWDEGVVNIITGTSVTCSYIDVRGGSNYSIISIGNYTGNVWNIGGSATIVANGHTWSVSGIGTYANNSENDFSPIYTVTNTDASGTGSLLYGLVGSAKYLVVAHAVTSCSSVLTTDVNRVVHICTGDGRSIVGGSVSISSGSTVSVNTTVDEYGGAQVAGSTVSVTGGSTTLTGNVNITGTLQPTGGLIIAHGSTISGVGSGAKISGTTVSDAINLTNGTVTMTNIMFEDMVNTYGTSNQNRAAFILAGTFSLTNCKFLRFTTSLSATGIFMGNLKMTITNCVFNRYAQQFSYHPDIYATTKSSIINVSGSTFCQIVTYNGGTISLSGINTVTGCVGKINTASGSDILILANGSTTNIALSGVARSIFSNIVSVEGTATIVYSSGTAKVTGTGTYFDKNGETDLTVVG